MAPCKGTPTPALGHLGHGQPTGSTLTPPHRWGREAQGCWAAGGRGSQAGDRDSGAPQVSRPGPAQLWEVGGLGASPQDRQPLPVPRCLWTALPTRVGAAGVAHAPSQGRLAQACTLPRLALVWLPWFQEAAATGAWVTPVLPGWLCAVERWRGRVRLEGDAWSLLAPKALAMLLRPRPRRRAALMGRWLSHGSRLRCSVPGPGLGLLHREQAWPSWEAVPAGPPLRFLCPALSSLLNINAGPGCEGASGGAPGRRGLGFCFAASSGVPPACWVVVTPLVGF